MGSHPVWVRGLKSYGSQRSLPRGSPSHPVWVRGLKSFMSVFLLFIK